MNEFIEYAPSRLIDAGLRQLRQSERDYFAAKAMQGICAHVDTWGITTQTGIAKTAYEIADAMLNAKVTGGQA